MSKNIVIVAGEPYSVFLEILILNLKVILLFLFLGHEYTTLLL